MPPASSNGTAVSLAGVNTGSIFDSAGVTAGFGAASISLTSSNAADMVLGQCFGSGDTGFTVITGGAYGDILEYKLATATNTFTISCAGGASGNAALMFGVKSS